MLMLVAPLVFQESVLLVPVLTPDGLAVNAFMTGRPVAPVFVLGLLVVPAQLVSAIITITKAIEANNWLRLNATRGIPGFKGPANLRFLHIPVNGLAYRVRFVLCYCSQGQNWDGTPESMGPITN